MSYCHEHQCCLLPKTNYKSSPAKITTTTTSSSSKMKTKLKTKFISSMSTSGKIKNILKPVIGKIFKNSKHHQQQKLKRGGKSNTYTSSSSTSSSKSSSYYGYDDNDDDSLYNYNDEDDDYTHPIGHNNNWWKPERLQNEANEELEERLIEEIQNSPDDAAIFIFNDKNGKKNFHSINKEKFYIPVHFARTSAGTFFWTTAQKPLIDPYKIEWNFLDRWAQA